MSIIDHTFQGYIIEYLPELPKTAKQVKKIYGREVKPIYWLDLNGKRLIKKNSSKDKYPYRYLRAESIGISLNDGSTMRRKLVGVTNWLWERWCANHQGKNN